MNHFDAVDFSECHSEEVMFLLTLSVIFSPCLFQHIFDFAQLTLNNLSPCLFQHIFDFAQSTLIIFLSPCLYQHNL